MQAVGAGGLAAQAGAGTSFVDMVAGASPTVQAVMLALVFASIWSWAVMIERALAFRRIEAAARRFETEFWSGNPLDRLYEKVGERSRAPIERVFVAGMTEWRRSFRQGGGLLGGTRDRVERAMAVAIAREAQAIGARLSFLATIGSVAPFVGLFATVWGIMRSFQAIGAAESTALAVVAPGIAEALLATALGLFVAIPAVIGYNRLLTVGDRLTAGLETFAEEFATILARQIDRAEGEAA